MKFANATKAFDTLGPVLIGVKVDYRDSVKLFEDVHQGITVRLHLWCCLNFMSVGKLFFYRCQVVTQTDTFALGSLLVCPASASCFPVLLFPGF
jgi:hypothetical protein